MTKAKLEIMLREAGKIARDKDFFLFGSQSLRAVCPRYPKEFPKTLEADLYPRNHPQAWSLLLNKMGRDSKYFRQHGVFLDCVDPGLATLPDGWTERLILFRTPRTGGVTAWCLAPGRFICQQTRRMAPKRSTLRPRHVAAQPDPAGNSARKNSRIAGFTNASCGDA